MGKKAQLYCTLQKMESQARHALFHVQEALRTASSMQTESPITKRVSGRVALEHERGRPTQANPNDALAGDFAEGADQIWVVFFRR
ncbi:hypothetical protein U27_06269 [Candidatus Vecturithrix granuli]|uniref:Uncharacterized protein n=1 Tax=Vecturithrix granuli TaxID=1499967 RepID=A0A081C3Y7_VECG1|nr:hypothetical protein U27_06269 [Candidatus Vecturithrix granuli]